MARSVRIFGEPRHFKEPHPKLLVSGRICPQCGGKNNIFRVPMNSTAAPRRFKCKWCDFEALESFFGYERGW
jgi:predicted RNA-binding Zn-ribbon protein involved in translation (DUF1610 family)